MHPYPAMVADDLALRLADDYVEPGTSVLDPFCGSGRLLAAAARVPGRRVGIDVNPLACLLTKAKLVSPDPTILSAVLSGIAGARARRARACLEARTIWKVQWFSPSALVELTQIVNWINALKLSEAERLIVAVALSAAARDVSYARKDGWKLHRLDDAARKSFSASAWDSFERRLRYSVDEVSREPLSDTNALIEVRDARDLARSRSRAEVGAFDVVLTSPPYGDSRTTVQYGAASALCLDFATRIIGLEDLFTSGRNIDARCLGGIAEARASLPLDELRPYWGGAKGTRLARAVAAFLDDYAQVCAGIARCLKPGGTAVLIVGQRSTGGYRLKLDHFTVDRLERLGLRTISIEKRRLRDKHVPERINRFARSASMRAEGLTRTMSSEIILAFRKTAENGIRRRH